jgi:hypothetical protein
LVLTAKAIRRLHVDILPFRLLFAVEVLQLTNFTTHFDAVGPESLN